jgi:hypothetical protein
MSDTEPDKSEEPEEKGSKEPNGTTLSRERWIETLNKHDSFDQYAKRRRERREEDEEQ